MMKPTTSTAEAIVAVLRDRPSALVTDIDGTISRIVPHPGDASVSAIARESLEALSASIDLVAVVTARDEGTARRMVGAAAVTYVGNYGLIRGIEGDMARLLKAAAAEARAATAALPCVQIEEKGVAFALHYRNCDDAEGVRQRLLDELVPIAARYGARVLEGKRVLELVPSSLPDKASAVARLARQHRIRGLVYLGDDVSDVAVFREVRRRRAEEGCPGLAIAVIDGETDDSVRAAADLLFEGVDAVERLLADAARELSGEARDA